MAAPEGSSDPFRRLYSDLGFLRNEVFQALHQACQQASFCWSKVKPELRPQPSAREAQISRPWVGCHFNQSRLLVVGLNMNGEGGFDALKQGIARARKELMTHNLVLANEKYRGTLFEYRMLAFAWKVIYGLGFECPFGSVDDIVRAAENPKDSMRDRFVGGYDWIAFTQVVKCGPVASESFRNGKPSREMVSRCPMHVLANEIAILKPESILSLGRDAEAAVEALPRPHSWKHFSARHPNARWRGMRAELDAITQHS